MVTALEFSVPEFSAATCLNCSKLPEIPQKLTDVENFDEHESTYWDDLIGNDLGEIGDEWIVKKLNSKNFKDPRKKLQLCCLLLVDALLCPRNLDRKISEVHVELVRDVEKFLNYPWGREAFSLIMKSIKTRGAEGLCQKTLAIQGFLHGMQLAMLKCIPHIKTRATYMPGAKKKKKGSTYATTSDEEVEVDDNTSLKPLTIKMSKIHDMDSKGKSSVTAKLPVVEGSEDDFKFDDEAVDTKVDNLLESIVNGPAFTIRCLSGGKHFNDVPPSVRQAKRKSATASGTGTTDEMHVVAEEIAGSYHKQAMEALQQVELRFLKHIEDLKAELAKSKSTATEKAHVMDVDKDAHPNTEKGENDKQRDLSSNDKEGEEDQASPTDKNTEKGENDKKRDLSSNDKEGEEYQASPTDKTALMDDENNGPDSNKGKGEVYHLDSSQDNTDGENADLRDGPNAMEIDTQKVIPSTSEIANETMDISTSDAEQSFVCPDKSKTNSIIPQKKRTAKAVDLPQTSSKVQKTSTSESLDKDKFETRKEILVRDSIQDNVSVSRKKLLVLDLNGLLANIIDFKEASDQGLKGTTLNWYLVLEKKINLFTYIANVEDICTHLLEDFKGKLLFCWDMDKCTKTEASCLDNKNKKVVFKDLSVIWKKGDYCKSNTVLLDDSPYKALLNPPHTAIFPYTYNHGNENDTSLGDDGDLRLYLKKLVEAENVQEFIQKNPFGQEAIKEGNKDWQFNKEIEINIGNNVFCTVGDIVKRLKQQNQTHTHHYLNSNFPPNYDRPPATPNFIVQLLHLRIFAANSDAKPSFSIRKHVISTLATLCEIPNDSVHVPQFGCIAGSFSFRQWVDALSAVVALWDYRLQGKTLLVPELVANVSVPSEEEELRDRICDLFSAHVLSLMENGDCVKNVRAEIEEKDRQVESFSSKRGIKLEAFERKKALIAEKDLIVKRLEEFKNGMKNILKFLQGRDGSVYDGEKDYVAVFSLEGTYDWPRIHSLIRRECRRLEDGLPIYAYRQNILKRIHGEQVMVLIGETGSGKSTQLVQLLADPGVAAAESIVCTQPRKIAALTLADRFREESNGCYEENSVPCTPAFFSTDQISSKVVFMTDNCLLQHYIKDRSLSGVSCIVIDEAHERSLNTDLLLALLKDLMCRRIDLRLVIMSATADAYQLSDYFFGCGILCVTGRNFPVEIIYSPSDAEGTSGVGRIAPHADVVKKVVEVHKTEKEGTILAFLTSQAEVEWACERFVAPSAVALPLHGKLSFKEQFRVFQNHPGKRKVIFATNIAETSLTIPGVKYVIDSGMVKESKYEPRTSMSILKVCRVIQSSARQRAGRAGRTEPGRCYRLYSKHDFESMNLNQEPEIRRVHLGVALLRILALGADNVAGFDFVDAPVPEAIAMAVKNLVQLGAVVEKNGVLELTQEGHCLVKLGLEPKLGKLILGCFRHRMGREGIVLASVMANASSIFCRVGSLDDKMKADCLKVQFCNPNGDLFTLLSVYKEWESLPRDRRNKWCWEDSLNAKSLRRCEDTVKELEICIERELSLVSPSYWVWNPTEGNNKHDKNLKKVILASLAENVAMYTGYDQLGYEVALTGQQVQLHPSCSLLAFGEKPNWVVFGELLSVVDQYLVCVTAFDFEALSMLDPPPPFDSSHMDEWRLRVEKVAGCSSTLLKRFCGKSNHGLLSIVSRARSLCMDERISIQVDIYQNEILLYAPPQNMGKVSALVSNALKCEQKWMRNECLEKYIYNGRGQVPMALFGSGAQIKHLEVDQRFLTVDVFYYGDSFVDDRELLRFLEKKIDGCICSILKFCGNKKDCDEKDKWGRITFLTPETAMKAT
ncbi:hypothetical protein Bca101_082796 [Brassica carinata]